MYTDGITYMLAYLYSGRLRSFMIETCMHTK